MPIALLLAMQAAGMVVDYLGAKEQQRFGQMGLKIQQAGIETNISQTRLETEEASLQALKELRKNMGTQLAVFAARGTSTSGGSSVALFQESLGSFNKDERMRRMNQLGRETELRAGGSIAKLNQQAADAKLWQGFAQRTFNLFPTSLQGWEQAVKKGKSAFGLTPLEG